MSCPVCEGQGNIYNAMIIDLGIMIKICDKCEACWTQDQIVRIENFKRLTPFLEEYGLTYKDDKMKFVKLVISISGHYRYQDASNEEMTILGLFLSSDVSRPSSFINWALDPESDHACANLTDLDKENDYIVMSDLYSEEETPTELKMTQKQFVQILTDWEEKVCKLKPKEVTITYDNDEFVIETKN